jgi:hypothetical protein
MIQAVKRDIAAGAFSSDSQVRVENKSSRLQVSAANVDAECELRNGSCRNSGMRFESWANNHQWRSSAFDRAKGIAMN